MVFEAGGEILVDRPEMQDYIQVSYLSCCLI